MRRVALFILFFALPMPQASAAGHWTGLKAGLSRGETSRLLGEPLLATSARGFDVAIYDQRGELLFVDGRLVAWTAPVAVASAACPSGVWSFVQQPIAKTARPATRLPASRGKNVMPSYRL